MKSICFVIITMLFLCFKFASAEYWYAYDGQRNLTVSDSIVTIKFDPGVPSQHYSTFADGINALDETYPPEEFSDQFYAYHITDGYNYDSVVSETENDLSVLFVFPSLLSEHGSLFKLSDFLLISFHDTVSQSMIDSVYQYYNIEQIKGPLEYSGTRALRLTENAILNSLEIANSIYETIPVNFSFPEMAKPEKYDYTPNDPLFFYQYHLYNYGQTGGLSGIDIGMVKAWEYLIIDSEIVIAILDDGFVQYHEDYNNSNCLWSEGYDFVGTAGKIIGDDDDDPSPGSSVAHGVACQGIILAEKNNNIGVAGIAPDFKLLPIKVWDDLGAPGYNWEYEEAVQHAIDYYNTTGIRVIISCSWGWLPDYGPPNLANILETAFNLGIPAVFSAGNFGEATQSYPIGYQIAYPAHLPTTIAVGAVRKTGEHWNYSCTGPQLDVVAPSGAVGSYDAGDIYTLDQIGTLGWNPDEAQCTFTSEDYLCTFGGTSASCPQVSGSIALLMSRRLFFHLDTLFDVVRYSARDQIGDSNDSVGHDIYYGYGLASASRMLLSVSRGDPNNNGKLNIKDITYLLDYIYYSGPEPVPDLLMGDANCDGAVDILDVDFPIAYLYHGGPPPSLCFEYND